MFFLEKVICGLVNFNGWNGRKEILFGGVVNGYFKTMQFGAKSGNTGSWRHFGLKKAYAESSQTVSLNISPQNP